MIDAVDALDTGALFSPCRRWRYLLWRRWERAGDVCVFIGLNPSTADETADDPTIRRCINFAKSWGYGELWMLNAYAFRATDPKAMKAQGPNAVGPLNDEYIRQAATHADVIVAAWGRHCDDLRQRRVVAAVASAGKAVCALKLCAGETRPNHPLYLRADLRPFVWDHAAALGRTA